MMIMASVIMVMLMLFMCQYFTHVKQTNVLDKFCLSLIKHRTMNMFGEVEVKLHAVLIPTLDGDEWSWLCPNHFILTIITRDVRWIGAPLLP